MMLSPCDLVIHARRAHVVRVNFVNGGCCRRCSRIKHEKRTVETMSRAEPTPSERLPSNSLIDETSLVLVKVKPG
jgi:hypothetical protein